jgi:DNA-binding response OmpR family regulator
MNNTILIVDDEPAIREILTFLFKKKKWTVLEAEDGFDALLLYNERKPAIVLTDINMPQKSNGEPGLNGIDFIKKMKEEHSSNLPLIFVMSGFLDNKEKVELLNIVTDYFEKPGLSEAVNKILDITNKEQI